MRLRDGRLDWAIIPAAGKGTRLRPATLETPKVLLPVGGRPMLEWAVEEAVCSGVADIAIVVGADQPQVRSFVEGCLRNDPDYAEVGIHFVVQPETAGIGDALVRCRSLTGERPFGVVVPDNWFAGDEPALAFVGAGRDATGLDTLGLIEVTPAQAPLLGNVGRVELEPLAGEGAFRILHLGDKAPGAFEMLGEEPSLRGCARYALNPGFYDVLERTKQAGVGEWDDVPAFQHLAATAALAGQRIPATLFDVGQPAGYRAVTEFLEGRATDDE